LHRLELRFAGTRLVEPRAVARIAHSIERYGQIVPCVVVAVSGGPGAGSERLVLIDGYRRVAALRRLGRDTASVEQWTCELTDAPLGLLARTQNRSFASIEEALLIRELMQALGLSQHDLARRCGRDVSWVSRRLQLLSGLPDAALLAVREGTLSSWAATRVVVPLARAKAEHADQLLTALADAPLSTRELRCWFEHYQKAFRSPSSGIPTATPSEPWPASPATIWSAVPVCLSTPCARPASSAPASVCATDPRASAPPTCGASRRSSRACASVSRCCVRYPRR
jgi:ParB family chromosome partitioning protein